MVDSVDDQHSIDVRTLRPGKYSPGTRTVDAILQAALHVLIEEGATAFTLRRIATVCNLQVGNVSKHFPRKEMLVQVLLDEILTSTEDLLKKDVIQTGMSAEDALTLVIAGTLDDIGTKRVAYLFTELWAMSNHNAFVAERMAGLDRYVIRLIGSYVEKLNPLLSPDQVETVSLFINASIDGATMVAGFGRPWEKKLPLLRDMFVKQLINMVKTITPDEVASL